MLKYIYITNTVVMNLKDAIRVKDYLFSNDLGNTDGTPIRYVKDSSVTSGAAFESVPSSDELYSAFVACNRQSEEFSKTYPKDIMVNGEGYKLRRAWAPITVDGGTLILNGEGVINCSGDMHSGSSFCIAVVGGGTVIINGNIKFTGNCSAIYCLDGYVEINGGIFECDRLHESEVNDNKFLLNCNNEAYLAGKANIVVRGGTYHGFDPANCSGGAEKSLVAEGFKSNKLSYTDSFGTPIYCVVENDN